MARRGSALALAALIGSCGALPDGELDAGRGVDSGSESTDASPAVDAARMDAARVDATSGADAGGPDAGERDAGERDAGSPDAGAPIEPGFHIHLDYRFAGAWFDDPARRRALEDAALLWERLIHEEWHPYPAGSVIRAWNYLDERWEDVTLESDVDGLLLFVHAMPLTDGLKARGGYYGSWQPSSAFRRGEPGTTSPTWHGFLIINTTANRPWFFDSTLETTWDLPVLSEFDFVSTISHEIGHAIGFLRTPYSSTGNLVGDTFVGPMARAIHGGPVPLVASSSHIHDDASWMLPRPWIDQHSMCGSAIVDGIRTIPTALDAAMLADIGWNVMPAGLGVLDTTPTSRHPASGTFTTAEVAEGPRALWDFSTSAHWLSPVIGRPVLFIPALAEAHRTGPPVVVDGGLRLPPTSYLMIDHGVEAQAPAACVNRYSMVWRVRIPALGTEIPLYNTNRYNSNGPEASIDAAGRFGEGSTRAATPLVAGRWTTLAVSIDALAGVSVFYQDGAEVARGSAGSADGRFAIGAPGCSGGIALLFAGASTSPSARFDAAGAALWDRVLTPAEMARIAAEPSVARWPVR